MDQLASKTTRALQREQEMKFGTQITPEGVRFRLWAPGTRAVSVKVFDPPQIVPMKSQPRDWFEAELEGVGAGARYVFVLDDGTEVPDPASRFQPDDVHGPSEVIDPLAFTWTDIGWGGRPWEETVCYEIHVGTFTPEGTFLAAIEKLDYLVDLGVTAVELMPIADFKGRWNWGYDGALLFAPDSSYGRPEELKGLIDAAHARGLMVFLDVVYNHFGPEGNYLEIYAPALTDKHETAWGKGVNFDDDGSTMVRDFVMANARYWLNEYRFDGLRFDAVHAIADSGPKHMLQDLAEQIRAATDGRQIHLIAENSDNEAGWLKRRNNGTPGLYTAQWSDDIHHCLHALSTGENFWYYADYAGHPELLARALAEGMAWQGEFMPIEGKTRGEPSAQLPQTAMVSFIQNHDHIGNRPFGERIGQLVSTEAARALAAIYLLSPEIPLVFMGEEWSADQPFLFFSDLGGELADKIREGRAKELKKFPGAEAQGTPPDPESEESFIASKLSWDDRDGDKHRRHLSLYRKLLQIRREEIVPRLAGQAGNSGRYELIGPGGIQVWWKLGDGSELSLIANLSPEPLDGVNVWAEDHLWLEGFATGHTLEPWGVVFRLQKAK